MRTTIVRILYWGVLCISTLVEAQTYQVIYAFSSEFAGNDPTSTLLADGKGNFYGTTFSGGSTYGSNCSVWGGCGTIFKITSTGKRVTLFDFGLTPNDGQNPYAGVIADRAGNLYGTTVYGGSSGNGIVYRLDTKGHETILHDFSGATDGKYPDAGLVMDSAGNLYGAAQQGGDTTDCQGFGCGTIYKIASDGAFSVVYTFTGSADGAAPTATLIRDASGNLYGTATSGGIEGGYCSAGCGGVFKVDTAGRETVLHSFAGPPNDGSGPTAPLALDSAGNLYGTTTFGGTGNVGTAFKVDTNGTETVVFNFQEWPNPGGQYPHAGLLLDRQGNLYGATSTGGKHALGALFEISVNGKLTPLHYFAGDPTDGGEPDGTLITDGQGNGYGTAAIGGNGSCPIGCGVIYKISR